MTKPTKRPMRPVETLCCALYGYLWTQTFFKWTAKTLIRLGGQPGWSESLLGAQIILKVLSCTGSNEKNGKAINNTINAKDLLATGMNLTVSNTVAKLKCIYIIVLINTGLKEETCSRMFSLFSPETCLQVPYTRSLGYPG